MNNRRHLFHLVNPSAWPILSSISAFIFVSALAFYMHKVPFAGYLVIYALICIFYCAFFWFNNIIDESTRSGYHTLAVRMGLRTGFILFVISEIMLFFGFFWAFFHSAICPSIEVGSIMPPEGIYTIPVFEFPLFNTFILIFSGFSITWAHLAMSLGSYREAIDSFLITIILGFFFVILQIIEYYETAFSFYDSVYSCSFFMLTGLHGCHVIAGAFFILLCFIRLLNRHFLVTHYLGLIFAIWYWHFVDIVWILLFISIYCWGSL